MTTVAMIFHAMMIIKIFNHNNNHRQCSDGRQKLACPTAQCLAGKARGLPCRLCALDASRLWIDKSAHKPMEKASVKGGRRADKTTNKTVEIARPCIRQGTGQRPCRTVKYAARRTCCTTCCRPCCGQEKRRTWNLLPSGKPAFPLLGDTRGEPNVYRSTLAPENLLPRS